MTTRRLDTSGQLGEKTRELDDVKRGPQEVEWIRGMIEEQTNHSLERAGIAERVDRRSLIEQRVAPPPCRSVCWPPSIYCTSSTRNR